MEVHPLFSPVIILYLPPFSYLLLSSSHITDTSAFDEVDIQHVRQNIQYVNMFVRQKFGNEHQAISMMVSCVIVTGACAMYTHTGRGFEMEERICSQ